jgi:phospholipid/cholesterol/gamma-HCH transport system ATP-binding protein
MKDEAIRIVDLRKSFGSQEVLKGVNLGIERGKITVIMGRSGGGKSVLLKHVIGLMRPDSGRIFVEGKDITLMDEVLLDRVRMNFGMCFQDAALFDSMNAGENVAFPLRMHTRKSAGEIEHIVREKLAQVGLKDVEHNMPSELSGGMRKRVGLARALALDPRILLFDEPTTGLDPIMSDAINELIIKTQETTAATLVVISHDVEGTFKVADKVAMLFNGRILLEGSPEEVQGNTDAAVRQFIEGRAAGPIPIV